MIGKVILPVFVFFVKQSKRFLVQRLVKSKVRDVDLVMITIKEMSRVKENKAFDIFTELPTMHLAREHGEYHAGFYPVLVKVNRLPETKNTAAFFGFNTKTPVV